MEILMLDVYSRIFADWDINTIKETKPNIFSMFGFEITKFIYLYITNYSTTMRWFFLPFDTSINLF